MNAKLVLALIAVAVVAVSAKPATRLENAVQEAALAFRDAATSAIKNAEGSALSEVEHLAGAATGMVTGATSPAASVGFLGSIGNFFSGIMNSILGIFGMGKPALPSVGGGLPGVGGAGSMLSHIPIAGAALGEAEKLASSATGGKLRRKRDTNTPAAGAPAAGAPAAAKAPVAGTPPTGPAGAAAVPAVQAANTTANCSDVDEGFFSKIIKFFPRLLGLASPALPLCSNATATAGAGAVPGAAAAAGAAGGAAAGAAHPAAGAPAAAAGTAPAGTPAAGRRKRSPVDLNALENMAAGALGGGSKGNNVAGMLGQASNLMGAVTGQKCVLTWPQWIFSCFGLFPNACTMANAVGGLMG